MKLTIKDITKIGFSEALGELLKYSFPIKTTMQIAESTTIIDTKLEEYAKIENAKLDMYGKKDENNKLVKKDIMNMPGRSIVEFATKEDEDKYINEMNEVKKKEIEIPLSEPIDIIEVEKRHKELKKPFDVTPETIINLGKLVKPLKG